MYEKIYVPLDNSDHSNAAIAVALTTLLAAMPYHLAFTYDQVLAAGLNRPFWNGGLINPLGAMIPWKVLALMSYTLIAIGAVVWYLRGLPGVIWGTARPGEQRLPMVMTVQYAVAGALSDRRRCGGPRLRSRLPF